jgi:CHAT domain-containing protein
MQLNTNADIVILSACNTASVEDQYSGSFSGLAKAFFISGSKSLLVSNWYVETKATQKLVTKFIKNFSANELSYAENLNLTMREFINESSKNSHPIYWAPFVFVGQDRYNRVPY